MSDDQEDILDTGDLDSGLEDFGSGKSSFAGAIKSNPMVKIGIVLGAFVLIVGGIILFGGKKEPVAQSTIKPPAELNQAPGMEKTSPVYEEAVKDMNEQNVEKAIREGGSALPVPIGPSRGRVEVDNTAVSTEDPLERWRKIQEERLRKEQLAQATVAPQTGEGAPVDPYAEAKQALSTSMATQMQSVLDGVTIKSPKTVKISSADYIKNKRKAEQEELENARQASAERADNAPPPVTTEVLLEAGRIEYAQLIIEANTDSPGPVLAELASGPLAGSRMIGTFVATSEYLTLNFTSIIVDGVAMTTEAIALDPATSKPGMVTEIDHKYFRRVILPAAAAFIEGIGGAIGESGSTTVSAGVGTTTSSSEDLDARQEFFKGVEKASEKLSDILDENGEQVKPMLRLAAGTHIGVLFTKPVEKVTGQAAATAVQPQGQDQAQVGQGFQMPFPGLNQMQAQGMMPAQYPYQGQIPQALMPPGQQAIANGTATSITEKPAGQ
jgi:intracellular multiplication protein IcmE